MRTLLLSTTFFCISLSQAQTKRFVKYYQADMGYSAYSYGIENTSYGYLLAGITVDTLLDSNGYWTYVVMGIDFAGDKMFEKRYSFSNCLFPTGLYNQDYLANLSGRYFSAGYTFPLSGGYAQGKLMCFNEQGDTLWTKNYVSTTTDSNLVLRSVSKAKNGDLLLSGYTASSQTTAELLIRTDSLGNPKFYKNFPAGSNHREITYSREDSLTNNLILVGTLGQYGNILLCDSMGTPFSQKNWSGSIGGAYGLCRQVSNGDFIVSGIALSPNTFGGITLSFSHLVRFDGTGNLIWKKDYAPDQLYSGAKGFHLIDGDTIVAFGEYDTMATQSLGSNPFYRVMKIDPSNGEIVWERTIQTIDTLFKEEHPTDMVRTPDGGFALTGDFSGHPYPNPFVLVKLDKYGCDTAGCQFVSMPEHEELLFDVFPNPARETLTIRMDNKEASRIELWDALGRKVRSQNLDMEAETSVDVSNLNPGLYIVLISDYKGVIGQRKVVIAR